MISLAFNRIPEILNIPTCLTADGAQPSDTSPVNSLVWEDFFLSENIYLKIHKYCDG